MSRNFGKWIGIAVMAAMFCVVGLVMSGEAHANRFVNNGNGTVTDTQTGLMWADKDNGSQINWYDAKIYCEGYSGGGKSGWRMPTVAELEGLYNAGIRWGGDTIKFTHDAIWSSEIEATLNGTGAAVYVFWGGGYRGWARQWDGLRKRALPVRSGG